MTNSYVDFNFPDNHTTQHFPMDFYIQNKYQLKQCIGSGSFGYVYRAVDERNVQVVVVKIGSERDMKNDYCSLNNEMEVLQRLEHENVIKLLEFSKFSGNDKEYPSIPNAMLVLENCICDLKKITLLCPRLNTQDVKTIAKHIFSSLAYLEERGILHCDIKPSNILLSSDGKMKLCDFGSARQFGYNGPRGEFTILYAPIEVLLGVSNVDYAADAWSAGCTFMELCMGKLPFKNLAKKQQITAIFKLCGSFTEDAWLALVPYLPDKYKEKRLKYTTGILSSWLQESLSDTLARELICRLLVTDPKCRWTSKQILELPYFQNSTCAIPDLKNLVAAVQSQLANDPDCLMRLGA